MNTMNLPARVQASRSGATSLVSRTPMDLEAVRRHVPSIFAEDKHISRSAKYTYIPTSQILEGLMGQGFQIFSAMQGGSRIEGKREFTKHVVRLRHPGTSQRLAVGDSFPEIILGNSHDGTSAYTLRAGVFRLACLNGMVVAQQQIADVRIPHKGDILGQVIDGCIEVMQQMPQVSDQIQQWSALQLNQGEQVALASAALALRYDGDAPIGPNVALRPRRMADNRSDLWTTFNRIQEALTKGGDYYTTTTQDGRLRSSSTRAVNGIDGNTALNRGLWTLAAEMAKLKA
jgi:hypothetical protein